MLVHRFHQLSKTKLGLSPSRELLPMFGLIRHWSAEDHEAPFQVRIRILFFLIVDGPGQHISAGCLLESVLDWIAMVVARHLGLSCRK